MTVINQSSMDNVRYQVKYCYLQYGFDCLVIGEYGELCAVSEADIGGKTVLHKIDKKSKYDYRQQTRDGQDEMVEKTTSIVMHSYLANLAIDFTADTTDYR